MWEVYFAFGFHEIRIFTDEEFETVKKFYNLTETKDGKFKNAHGDIHAWRKKVE